MINLAIDIGSYSVKILQFENHKNKVIFTKANEIVLATEEVSESRTLWDLQYEALEDYISQIDGEIHYITNIPAEIMTTRYLTIPVANKKKAAQMLPFMLEEDLPTSLSECHFDFLLDVGKSDTNSTVGVVNKSDFQQIYNYYASCKRGPFVLTSQLCSFSAAIHFDAIEYPQAFAIIDIGHKSTKAYFYLNQKLVANNFSFMAGEEVTKTIATNYQITEEEAVIYKHQNAFFLLDSQLDQVNEKQRVFAQIMKKTISPLLDDLKRWALGFRVHHGLPLEKIYITGGTSNTKNIAAFLTSEIKIKTEHFECMSEDQIHNLDHDPKLIHKFTGAASLSLAQKKKSLFFNFLRGDFAIQGSAHSFPTEGLSLLGIRAMIIAFIFSLHFGLSAFYTNSEIKNLDRKIVSVLKNNTLKIIPKQQREAARNPLVVLNKLKRDQKNINQEINVVQSALDINALAPILKIQNYLEGRKIEIIQLTSTHGSDFSLTLKAKESKPLEIINQSLKKDFNNIFTRIDTQKNILIINGEQI